MRYYKIVVGSRTFTSYEGGKNLPGALDVELDIPIFAYAQPAGAAIVKIWGVSIKDISQASDFNNMKISVEGGFQKGLPLANPAQAGLLAKGKVFQAFGNWVGTDQSVDLIFYGDVGRDDDPKNIVLNWKKGTKMKDAVQSTLSTAFPDFSIDVKIKDGLVIQADEPGYNGKLSDFARYLNGVSKQIIKDPNYPGVDIALSDDKLLVYDGSTPPTATKIEFKDMIGQPTWINPRTVQTKLAMRKDLIVGGQIKFPPALVTTSVGTTSPFGPSAKSIFQGEFAISKVRHVGNFRQSDASSWVTVVDAYSTTAA